MSEIWYKVTEQFTSEYGESWNNYIEWSGLHQLKRVVSVDCCLCPSVINKYIDEDWEHNVKEDYLTDCFIDLKYLLSRVEHNNNKINILALLLSPEEEVSNLLNGKQFNFVGYDLTDFETGISALTNCGGFEKSFANSELTENGLLSTFTRAKEVQKSLITNYPDEPHAICAIWALWIKE